MHQSEKIDKKSACPTCFRPASQCICGHVSRVENHIRVLILQYPQEQYKLLNSARLVSLVLGNCVLRIGLSWPNFSRALGENAEPAKWGVLYLGSGAASQKPVQVLNRKKKPIEPVPRLEGIVALDGTWKQSKTLWWRNPWLLKLKRVVLNPAAGSLRNQVKKEALSTAEAVAMALDGLGEAHEVGEALVGQYRKLIIEPNVR